MRILAITALVILSSSCVTLSKEQCQTMNWFERGKADGMMGLSASQAADYQSRCSKFGYGIDLENYTKGRETGLTHFCTLENGEKFGKYNGHYSGVCPIQLEADFLKGYNLGKKYADLRRRERELADREYKLHRKYDACRYDSDCGVKGRCVSESYWLGLDLSHFNQCRYDR